MGAGAVIGVIASFGAPVKVVITGDGLAGSGTAALSASRNRLRRSSSSLAADAAPAVKMLWTDLGAVLAMGYPMRPYCAPTIWPCACAIGIKSRASRLARSCSRRICSRLSRVSSSIAWRFI
jgi:hypothetical protein